MKRLFVATFALSLSTLASAADLPSNGFICKYKTEAGKQMTIVSFNEVPRKYDSIWPGQVLINNGTEDQIFEISKISVGRNGIAGRSVTVLADNARAGIKISYLTAAPSGKIEITTASGKKIENALSCVIVNKK